MRILVSTPTFLPVVGGAQLGIHEIYHRLGQTHEVTILTPHLPRHSLEGYGAQDYTSDNYEVRHIFPSLERALPHPVKRVLKRTSWLYTAELARTMRRARPDAINFHFVKPHGGALIAINKLYGVPTALSLVGRSDVIQQLSTSKRWYAKQVIDRADVVLPNSTYYLGSKINDPGVQIIPYGVDIDEFAPSRRQVGLRRELGFSDDHFVLFSVQRLTSVKRVDLLVRVMAEVVPQNPRVVLLVGGKGEEEPNLHTLVAELGLEDNVRFCGYIDSTRLPEYFASADAFVFHSLIETFGIVFAQAMASGLPIIAADTSCVSDVLSLDNGSLVTPFDTAAFAGAVLSLAENPETARRIGVHNRAQAVNDFNWDRIAAQYERALHDIAAGIR
jgi:glycosyltransferase involved in cell wall biosynthesis